MPAQADLHVLERGLHHCGEEAQPYTQGAPARSLIIVRLRVEQLRRERCEDAREDAPHHHRVRRRMRRLLAEPHTRLLHLQGEAAGAGAFE